MEQKRAVVIDVAILADRNRKIRSTRKEQLEPNEEEEVASKVVPVVTGAFRAMNS